MPLWGADSEKRRGHAGAGRILVYSTCTFAPGEDEGQIAAFWQGIEFTCVIFPAAVLASPVKPTGQGTIRYRQNTAAASGPVMAARAIYGQTAKGGGCPPAVGTAAWQKGKGKAAKTYPWMLRHCRRGRALPRGFSPHLAGPAHCSGGGAFFAGAARPAARGKLHAARRGARAARQKGALNRPTRCLWLTVPSAPIVRS